MRVLCRSYGVVLGAAAAFSPLSVVRAAGAGVDVAGVAETEEDVVSDNAGDWLRLL